MSTPIEKPPARSWRDVIKVHPDADRFPMMSPDELRELGEDIRENGLTSPISLWSPNDDPPVLLDGRNRLDAMELVGINLIGEDHWLDWSTVRFCRLPAEVAPFEYVVSANVHRRHLSAEKKREVIAELLKARPDQSNVQIAKATKVDDKTVAKVRREMESTSEIPRLEKTVGADGKKRKAPNKKPTKKPRRDVDDFVADVRAKAVEPVPAPPSTIASWAEGQHDKTKASAERILARFDRDEVQFLIEELDQHRLVHDLLTVLKEALAAPSLAPVETAPTAFDAGPVPDFLDRTKTAAQA